MSGVGEKIFKPNQNGKFECEHCNESFSRKNWLKIHLGLNKKDGKIRISCPGLDPSLKKKMISEYPHLVKEYNGNEDLTKITDGSRKFLDWKCSTCEHEWSAEAGSRAKHNSGCPACINRVVNNYDGRNSMAKTHPELAKEYQGDATKIIAGTKTRLDWKCSTCEHEWSTPGYSRITGRGCVVCNRGGLHSDGRNSMAKTHPELAKEYQGDASKIIAGTMKRLEWKCSTCEHEWKASGNDRKAGKGCRVCGSGGLHSDGRNSMAKTHPELAKEYLGDATKIVAGTNKILNWKCSTCEHEWKAAGSNRVSKGSGCPSCVEYGFDTSKPAYVYQIRFHTQNHGVFYKCGITNRDYEVRAKEIINSYNQAYDDLINVRINDEVYFEDGSVAKDFETNLKNLDCKLSKEYFSQKFFGYDEIFAPSVVPFWDTLKAEYTDVSNL